ncbi:MAG: RNA polymerase sigma factor [Actinomycetota bacterium]
MRPRSERRRPRLLDDATIRTFLRDDYARVVGAVALVSGSRPAAEDAVQEALLRAWSRSEHGETIESLASWVVTVALNLSRSGVRRAFAERRARSKVAALHQLTTAGPSGDATDVQRALTALPRRQREVVVLRLMLEMDTAETARSLGITEGTVKSTLSRAREVLADALGADDRADDREEVSDRGEPR